MEQHYAHYLNYAGERLSGNERSLMENSRNGFAEGREFRSFWEFSLATAEVRTIRVASAVPFILYNQTLLIDAGGVRFEAISGAATGGTYGTLLPIIGKNRHLSRPFPYYEPQCVLDTGGTAVGGTVVEVIRASSIGTGTNTGTVGHSINDERALPAGTYYLRITNLDNGTSSGIYNLWWEERP